MAAQILPLKTLAMPVFSRALLEDLLTEVNPELELLGDHEMDDLIAQLHTAVGHYVLGYQSSMAFAAHAAEMAPKNHPLWAASIQSHYQRAYQSAQDPRIQPALTLFAANMEAAIH